ncbi:MAG: hypothetical protein KC621_01525 [Myxococcales bacterium]|nr:hypothetical protein [Myxococcales bacterium]
MFALLASLAAAAPIDPTPVDGGVPLVVRVVDQHGQPVGTATVRHLEERVSHPVNARTGRWRGEGLYIDERVVRFVPGTVVQFDVRAPGHLTTRMSYAVRAHRNVVTVALPAFDGVGSDVLAEAGPVSLTPAALISTATADDASSAADLAISLAAMGPDHADDALAWATEAMLRAQRTLSGPEFVEVMDRMYAVKALAAASDWQLAEVERITGRRMDTTDPRRAAATAAADWLDYARAAGTSVDLAQTLCASASETLSRCL